MAGESTGDSIPFFEVEGRRYRATARAVGPWDKSVVGGGPLAALLAHAITEHCGDDDFCLTRLTVDLLRPVPAGSVEIETRPLREGRRLRVVHGIVMVGGMPACNASAVFARALPAVPTHFPTPGVAGLPPPDQVAAVARSGALGYATSMEIRPVVYPTTCDLGIVWVRFAYPLLPGVALTPVTRAAITADAVSGFAFMTSDGVAAVNCDLTVYLSREPEGEWFCIEVTHRSIKNGIAVASARLRDLDGLVGHCLVSAMGVDQPVKVSSAA